MKSTTIIAGSLVAAMQFFGGDAKILQKPATLPVLGAVTPQGCFSSKGNLTEFNIKGLSSGSCNDKCKEIKALAFALSPDLCLCGDSYPPKNSKTKDDDCNFPCPGYGEEACGALGDAAWTVWNTGRLANVPYFEEEDGPTSTDSGPKPTSTDGNGSSPGADPSASSSSEPEPEKEQGPNVGGIIAGVVVGVVAVAAVCGGLWFFMRRRRNSEIEEEHRRNAAVNAFISGSKPPGSSGSISMTDHRLDPVMNHRRMSNGSIADNEDYSRKILRVSPSIIYYSRIN